MSRHILASSSILIVKSPLKRCIIDLETLLIKQRLRTYLLLSVLLFSSGISLAQSIFTNPITGSSISANPYSTGQVLNANITSTGIGRGSGLSASAVNDRYNVTSANASSLSNALSGNDFFEFSITPNSCFEINFISLTYISQISGGGINLALRSNRDSYASNIATSTATTGTTISLGAAAFQNIRTNITFRLYVWGASGSGTQFSINSFTFNGAVAAWTNTTTAGSSAPTLCVNTPLTNITHTTTGATGIGTATGLPSGVTATWSANTITISGTPTASGTFNYSIPLTGGCGSVNATGTITVTPIKTVGSASSTPTLCTNTPLTNITHTTTGATGIGTATGLPAGVTAAFASNTITISGTPTAFGTFNYSIPLTGGCGSVNATGTITVLNGTIDYANLQFPGSPTICIGNNLTAFGRIYKAGVTEAAGANPIVEAQIGYNATNTNPNTWAAGNWTNATYNVQVGNDDEYVGSFGSALVAGTYYYAFRYRMNGCAWQYGGFNGTGGGFYNGSTNNNGVLTISPNNTPGTASSNPTLCINTPLTNITRTTTGATGIGAATGLPAGVTAAFASNTITISGTPTASGTFNYSIPLTGGCGTANATGTITVTPANTISLTSAVGSNSQLRCINTAITTITYATSGATGATFSGLPPGVSGAWAAGVATISGTPTAYGFYNYTVTLTGGCGSVTATGSINVNGLDYANLQFPASASICVGNTFTAFGQVYELGITEAAGANANISVQYGYNNSNTDPSTWPAGNWSAASYNLQAGNNDEYTATGVALGAGTWYYTFRYSINGCSWQYGGYSATGGGFWNGTTNVSGVVTVTPAPNAGTLSGTQNICAAGTTTFTTSGNAGGTWTSNATGIATVNNSTGAITGVAAGTATITYTVTGTGGCANATATRTVTVTAAPNAGTLSGTQNICAAGTTTFTSSGNAGGAWTSDATGIATVNVSTGVITGVAAGTANITYTVTGTGGCANATATRTVTVTAAPNAGTLSGTQNICIAGTTSFWTNGNAGGTWSSNATGIATVNSSTGAITGVAAGTATITYTVAGTGGCANATATRTVTVAPNNTAGTVSSNPTLCINTALTAITRTTTGATGIGTATGLPAGVTATWASNVLTISGTPTASGTFNYSIPLTGGCGAVNATGTITVTPANTAGTASSNPTLCINTALTNITRTTTGATGIGAPTGLPAGVTAAWAANTITVSGTPTAVGTFNYSIPLTGGCGAVSATGTITVTPANTVTLSSAAGTNAQTRCINTAITNITYATTTATGATFSGLPAGVNGVWASNVATISGTPTAAGTFNYTVTLTGGCGAVNATGTITVTPANTAGTASSNPTLCINTALTAITRTTTGATGIGTATGLPAGVTATWASNVLTISGTPTAAGTFNYSIPLTGGCGSVNATGTITVTAAPTVGATANFTTICSGGTINLTGTSNVSNIVVGQENFENTSTYTAVNGQTRTGTSASSDRPANVSFVTSPTTSYSANDETATITTQNFTGLTPGAAKFVTMRLAAFSIGSSSGGLDSGDDVTVEISLNGGSTYSREIEVNGNSNCHWGFTSGTGVAATTYDGDNTATVFAPAGGGARTTDGFSTLQISLPTSATQVRVRVTMSNSSNSESWVIDDIIVSSGPTYSWTSAPAGFTSSLQNPTGVVVSGNTTYTLTVTNPTTGCSNSSSVSITANPNNTVGAASSTPTLCNNTALTAITHTTTGATSIGTATGLPSGVTAAFASNTITISGTPTASGTFNYSIPLTGCGAVSATGTITVTPNPTVNVGPGLAAICQGGVSANLGGSVTSPASGGTWSTTSGGTFSPSATALNATWTPPAGFVGTATLTLTSFGGSCGIATGSKNITVNPLPANAGTITGTATVCQNQTSVVYSIPAIANATSYTWSYSGTGFTASGSTASIFGSFSASATSGILTVRGVNSCGNGPVSANFAITVNSVPSAAGVITGSPSLCQGQTGVSFSVPPIPGATSYQWTYSGTGFTASGSTATITANFSPTATAGNLTVRGVNSCGNGVASANFPISLAQLPGTPGTILGPSTVCRGQVGFTFTIPAIANATSYSWVYTGTGITFSGNTSTVTAIISNTATSGVLRVRGVSACLNGPFSADFPVTVIEAPVVSISSNYCGNPGFVILTASSGFTNYVWSTGATTSFINADIAGQYTVTVANAFGCMASASVGVATELVTNGKFDLGNTGFSTNYNFVANIAGQTEMYPEGTYAVVPNANSVHDQFWGTGRTPSGGPFMVVNGHPALGQAVWSQNNIPVQPNTTYYFSAWGLSVVNGNNAALRFTINGNQVGTIANLPNGYSSTAGPFNWVRFYGSWNSGFETEADLSIINLNTILGGNDFGLDDISFGTLSPIPLTAVPGTSNGTNVCQGSQLVLNANAVGGASPFTYSWTGPNGFSSSDMNPVVTTNATAAVAGIYTVTVTDGFGCSVSSDFNLSVSPLPANRMPVATVPSVCVDGNSAINLPLSQTGVSYQLRNEANDAPVGDPIAGTGGTISFPVENLNQTTTYNVLATGNLSQCSVEMTNLATITVATTPVLSITNQAICSGTVNLTAPAVTAGSTGGGTLSYWTNAAGTVALSNPSTVSASGTYYIRSTVGSCSDIEPVSVSISTSPLVGFSYPGSPYCSIGSDPTAVLNSGAVAGTFSCANAGLVFSNPATGAIDLSASTPGTYTIVNTVSPTGGCPTVSANATVGITQAPLTGFSYPEGNDFCQIYNATNPAPIFDPGAAAGTFQSTFGLSFVSTSTGVVNLAASTPGNYAIWNSRPAIGGCAAQSDTVFIDINPYVFAGTVSSSVSDDLICLGETVDLFSQTSAYNSVLLRERFNGTINNWVRANSSSGGTVANAAWTLRPNNYNYGGNHRSNDDTQFYMSNSEAQAGTTTITTLRSPVMNTVGYTSLSMDFFHFFNTTNTTDSAQVQVSLNNSTWTTVATYTTNRGGATSFTNQVINLDAYIGQPIFYVRFRYRATNDRLWAIDNVSLTGNCIRYNYNWVSAPAGFTSTQADPVGVAPPQNSFYVVNATNTFGCSNPASPLPVTVNDLPVLTSPLTPPAVCGNELFNYTPTATPAGATVSWTRPVATGITNPAITTQQAGIVSETLENITGTDQNVVYNFTLNNNGCSQIVPVTVGIKPVPVIDIGSNLVACNGSPVQLSTTVVNGLNVSSYNWTPATGLNNTLIGDPTATLSTASQSYSVSVTASNGCVGTSNAVTISNFGFGGTAGLWQGTQNSNWDDCRNWADGKVPDALTNVTIDGNATNDLMITGNQTCNSLFFQSTGNGSRTVTLIANSTLTVIGNVGLSKSGGTGSIRLRVMNNATLSCNNLSIAGSGPGAANAIVEKEAVNSSIIVNGSLSLDPGALLDMSDNNNATQDGMLNLKGDFVNNAQSSDCNSGNTTIVFNGNSLQTITSPANQMFGKVVMDNSSTGGVRLNNSIRIQDGIDFVNGVIDLNQHVLTLGSASNNATITGSGNNSYILAWDGADNGTVVHHVNSGSASYIFPVGDLMEYTPFTVNLNSASLSNATITAKLYAMAHPNIVSSTNYIGRYWSIEPSGISNPNYSVEYGYAAADIFGSEAFLLPAKYSASTGGWQSCMESGSNAMIGNGSVQAGTNILTWTGLNSFSEFTAIGNGVPLPIELLSFTAEPVGSEVHLTWITATETNNSHFTVERSNDGQHFEKVAELPGAGNSNVVLNYSAVDPKPYLGVSYYRLKQTDYNGEFSYSEWAVVNFSNEAPIDITNVYPDPNIGALQIQCTNPANQEVQVTIFDAGGKLIYNAGQGRVSANWNGSIPLGTISRGSYILRVKMGDRLLHRKFIF